MEMFDECKKCLVKVFLCVGVGLSNWCKVLSFRVLILV